MNTDDIKNLIFKRERVGQGTPFFEKTEAHRGTDICQIITRASPVFTKRSAFPLLSYPLHLQPWLPPHSSPACVGNTCIGMDVVSISTCLQLQLFCLPALHLNSWTLACILCTLVMFRARDWVLHEPRPGRWDAPELPTNWLGERKRNRT